MTTYIAQVDDEGDRGDGHGSELNCLAPSGSIGGASPAPQGQTG